MTTKKATGKRKIRVGYGQADITPEQPFPLAGYVHRQERLADRVRDPLLARAAAFSDGKNTVAVTVVDLLLISAPLREAVEQKLAERSVDLAGLVLSATHSHSAAGGFVDRPSASAFMGRYRSYIFDGLVEGIAAAVAAAVKDLAPAELTWGVTQTANLNWNRRHKDGPVDRALSVVTVQRSRKKNLRIVTFGAHPVVVAEREHHAASACWPGDLCRSIEAEGDRAMVIVGPVGGVNVFFPEGPMEVETHMSLLLRLLREELDKAQAAAVPVKATKGVGFGLGETRIQVATPRLFPDRLAWLDTLALPLRLYVRHFARGAVRDGEIAQVPVARVGELIFTGFPADLGAGVGLAARRHIEEQGLRPAAIASQTGDYVGYVHLPDDYERFETENKDQRGMTIYENAMGWPGRQMGLDLLEAFRRGLAQV